VGTIGKVAIVPKHLDGANITQSSARLRPWMGFITSEYLAEVLRSVLLRSQYEKFRFGNAVQRLNIAHVRALAIPLPPLDEQKEIIKIIQQRVSSISAAMSAVTTSLEKLEDLISSILSKAFHGELVPQDPNDEPASILLERIRKEKACDNVEPKAEGKRTSKKVKLRKEEARTNVSIER
jgi:type I restriction enzyme S subunit